MRAISLWQPWASLWASGRKVSETRHWPTDYRGPLVIHASQKIVRKVDPRLAKIIEDEFGGHWANELPRGAIVGTCEIVACHRIYESDKGTVLGCANDDDFLCGNFSAGRFAWEAAKPVLFKCPIPWKGLQGFFDVPTAALTEIVTAAGGPAEFKLS